MQNKGHRFPREIYSEDLAILNNIRFTPREIDVMACFINARGTSKTASILSLSPRTVFVHSRNIMAKIGCNYRDGILDFIEKLEKLPILREYYVSLTLDAAFKEVLKNISKLQRCENMTEVYLYGQDKRLKDILIERLVDDLTYAGIRAIVWEQLKDGCFKTIKNPNQLSFIFVETQVVQDTSSQPSGRISINLCKEKNYYFAIFKILKTFISDGNLESLFRAFHKQYKGLKEFSSHSSSLINNGVIEKTDIEIIDKGRKTLKNTKWLFFIIAFSVVLFCFVLQITGRKEMQTLSGYGKPSISSIRSDLFIPVGSVLLLRSEEIRQIEEKFKGDGIQVVGLIGPGGAGKTTMARQYARQQDANVIWELNAETNESLKYSFESLARALVNTEEDKKILRSLQGIRDLSEKEEQLIQFVKERLKSHSNWILIFDNMEKFTDIQKYFPQDPLAWGEGKVILTTRNSNIHNSTYLNGAIHIKELNDEQKFVLFTKIMAPEVSSTLSAPHIEDVKRFLQKLPPYPLDIVVAAYYLKAAKIPYAEYLENLEKHNKDVAVLQEDLLQGAGSYTKTRYGILTLSLEQLINKHKDFKLLLLFISLLDSQNIPRTIFKKYKNNVIVDNFIYNLKKYSLITDESPPSSPEQTISFHRSTQEIILDYLVALMSKKEKSQIIYDIFGAIERYTDDLIKEEDISKIQLIATHCEALLKHNALLDNTLKNLLHGELGNLYYFLGDAKKGKELMEASIKALDKLNEQKALVKFLIYLGKIYVDADDKSSMRKLIPEMNKIYEKYFSSKDGLSAKILNCLGDMHDSLGDYDKAKDLLQKSVAINKKLSTNYPDLAWTLALLGNLCRKTGNYREAKGFFEESLGVYKNFISGDQFRTGWILIHLGNIYLAMGDSQKAHALIEEGIGIYKKYYPEKHPDLAWATGYLGNACIAVGEYTRAEDLLQKALKILAKNFSETHGTFLRTKAYLAKSYTKLSKVQEAKNILEGVLENYEQMEDADAIEFALATQDLAEIYVLENHLDVAEELMKKALDMFAQQKHPSILRPLESLAGLYLKKSIKCRNETNSQEMQRLKEQAIAFLHQAKEAVAKNFPEDSPHLRRIQGKLKSMEP